MPSACGARSRRRWLAGPAAGRRRRSAGPPAGDVSDRLGPRGFSSRARSPRRAEAPATGPVAAPACARHGRPRRWSPLRLPSVTAVEPRVAGHAGIPVPEAPSLAMPSLVPARHDAHGARHESENRTPSQTESLAIEVRALRNAERALRDGNPGLALAFLQELDRQVPNGQLAEERDAAGTARPLRPRRPPVRREPGGGVHRASPREASTARASSRPARATDSPPPGDSSPRRSER